jgi:hypothetical protein
VRRERSDDPGSVLRDRPDIDRRHCIVGRTRRRGDSAERKVLNPGADVAYRRSIQERGNAARRSGPSRGAGVAHDLAHRRRLIEQHEQVEVRRKDSLSRGAEGGARAHIREVTLTSGTAPRREPDGTAARPQRRGAAPGKHLAPVASRVTGGRAPVARTAGPSISRRHMRVRRQNRPPRRTPCPHRSSQ